MIQKTYSVLIAINTITTATVTTKLRCRSDSYMVKLLKYNNVGSYCSSSNIYNTKLIINYEIHH